MSELSSSVVYGSDDRRSVSETPEWKATFDDAVFALIPGGRLVETDDGHVAVSSMTLMEKFSVCAEEPFAGEVTAAACGGVLIESDLVLTAGHCFDEEPRCDQYAYVSRYSDAGGGVLLDAADVYGCRDVVARRIDIVPGIRHVDFAVVKLDRPARGRPVALGRGVPALGEAVTMLGFPNGLPGKVDGGGSVSDNAAPDHFQATVDAFAGNSGSPVFDQDAALRGLLVAGAPYDYSAADGCWTARHVGEEDIARFGTERIALPDPALEALLEVDRDATPPVRCTGLDCTANAIGEVQILAPPSMEAPAQPGNPPPGAETPPVSDASVPKTPPSRQGCSVMPAPSRHGVGSIVALTLFAFASARRRRSIANR